jgi:transcriptional regulator with XRE-family HTH domain
MITGPQLKAARALLGMDQRQLAELSGLSLPTIQRMESHESTVRCNVDSLMRVIESLQTAGVELISENVESTGKGRGVRLIDSGAGNP